MTGLDLDALTAIDVHVHVETDTHGHFSLPDPYIEASSTYFGADHRAPSIDQIAQYYRQHQTAAVIFSVDTEAATGHPALSNPGTASLPARLPPPGTRPPRGRPSIHERPTARRNAAA